MTIGNEDELDAMKRIGAIVARILRQMAAAVEPGIRTDELDELGRQALAVEGARSAPEVSYNFPGATCISVNQHVAHGIPGARRVEAGDLVNIDVSAEKDGYFADTGATVMVPPTDPTQNRLCRATQQALKAALTQVKSGGRINQLGRAVERTARKHGFHIIENLAGHGVGRSLHEAPGHIRSVFVKEDPRRFEHGQVVAIEPFLSTGPRFAEQLKDGWTLAIDRGHFAAQYEHTVVVTKRGPLILTRV